MRYLPLLHGVSPLAVDDAAYVAAADVVAAAYVDAAPAVAVWAVTY